MNQKLHYIFGLLGLMIVSTSFNHPIKLTSSLIEYDLKSKKMRMECRVFIDDFQKTLNRKDLDVSNLTKDDIAEIEYYFDQFYLFKINGKKLPFIYKNSVVYGENNVLSIKFEIDDVAIKNGDDFLIENKLFFTDFGFLQSNKMTIRMPPYVAQEYFECTDKNYTVQFTL